MSAVTTPGGLTSMVPYTRRWTKLADLIGQLGFDKPHLLTEYGHAMGSGPGG
jgi:hypothetical protein